MSNTAFNNLPDGAEAYRLVVSASTQRLESDTPHLQHLAKLVLPAEQTRNLIMTTWKLYMEEHCKTSRGRATQRKAASFTTSRF